MSNFVQSQTIQKQERLEEKNPAVRDEKFADLAATAADPVRHRAFLMRTIAVRECPQKSWQNISWRR
jgi:3-(3-hydroxy-phenyl)propionate hydroxylase